MPEVETIKRTRKDKRQSEKGRKNPKRAPLPLWSRMIFGILKGEAFKFFSTDAISRQSRAAVKRRSPTRRSAGARKAVRTKAPAKKTVPGKKTVRKKGG